MPNNKDAFDNFIEDVAALEHLTGVRAEYYRALIGKAYATNGLFKQLTQKRDEEKRKSKEERHINGVMIDRLSEDLEEQWSENRVHGDTIAKLHGTISRLEFENKRLLSENFTKDTIIKKLRE